MHNVDKCAKQIFKQRFFEDVAYFIMHDILPLPLIYLSYSNN